MTVARKLMTGGRVLVSSLFLLLMLIIGLFGLKGCFITVWMSPKSIETYAITGEDGRSMHIVFLPQNEAAILYEDPTNGCLEVARTAMRGEYGTHYIGPIWHLNGPGYWFGLRWYTKGEPVTMDIKVLKKYQIGPGDSSFPREGKSSISTIIFADDEIRFDKMWLRRVVNNPDILEAIRTLVPSDAP